MLARYTLRCFGCLAVDADRRVEEVSQKVEQQRQAGQKEAVQRMVHLLFFCFCWGSRRGFSTALGNDVSIRLWSGGVRKYPPDGLVKDGLEIPLSERRALEVFDRLDLLGAVQRLLVRHGRHALLGQTPDRLGVLAQIELGADKDDGDVGGVVIDLGVPLPGRLAPGLHRHERFVVTNLCLDVIKRWRADDREADEKHVGLGVGEGPESVVVFLARRIPEPEADRLAIYHHTRRVVVEAAATPLSASITLDARSLKGALHRTYTVGMYSPGKAFVVYEMRRHVC